MKLILIKASIGQSKKFGISDGISCEQYNAFGIYPSLGLLYLASSIKELCEVEIIDPDIMRLKIDSVAKKICEKNPDIVGIYIMSFTFLYALELARAIKKLGNPKIIVGGPHVGLYPYEIMNHNCFDIGVFGEGEEVMKDLIIHTKSRLNYSNIKGIIYRENGRILETPRRSDINNLDLIPFPARNLINIKDYYQPGMSRPFISAISTRGCPYKCTYCSKISTNSMYRFCSPEYMLEELIKCKEKYGIKSIHYFDDTFNVNKERTKRFCTLLNKTNLDITFSIRARVNNFDNEIARSLKIAGCTQVCFGLESGDPGILEKMDKGITIRQIKEAFSLCHQYKISPIAFFMVGHPDEKKEHIENTIKLIKDIKPNWFKANILTPYPGSKLYRDLIKEGMISDFWKKITLEGRVYSTPNISRYFNYDELERIRDKINSMPYFRIKTNLFKFSKVRYPRDIHKAISWMFRYSFIKGRDYFKI